MNGSACKVVGCGAPAVNWFCDRHNAAWSLSSELARWHAMRLQNPKLTTDDPRWHTLLADFARRVEAEERNSR